LEQLIREVQSTLQGTTARHLHSEGRIRGQTQDGPAVEHDEGIRACASDLIIEFDVIIALNEAFR